MSAEVGEYLEQDRLVRLHADEDALNEEFTKMRTDVQERTAGITPLCILLSLGDIALGAFGLWTAIDLNELGSCGHLRRSVYVTAVILLLAGIGVACACTCARRVYNTFRDQEWLPRWRRAILIRTSRDEQIDQLRRKTINLSDRLLMACCSFTYVLCSLMALLVLNVLLVIWGLAASGNCGVAASGVRMDKARVFLIASLVLWLPHAFWLYQTSKETAGLIQVANLQTSMLRHHDAHATFGRQTQLMQHAVWSLQYKSGEGKSSQGLLDNETARSHTHTLKRHQTNDAHLPSVQPDGELDFSAWTLDMPVRDELNRQVPLGSRMSRFGPHRTESGSQKRGTKSTLVIHTDTGLGSAAAHTDPELPQFQALRDDNVQEQSISLHFGSQSVDFGGQRGAGGEDDATYDGVSELSRPELSELSDIGDADGVITHARPDFLFRKTSYHRFGTVNHGDSSSGDSSEDLDAI